MRLFELYASLGLDTSDFDKGIAASKASGSTFLSNLQSGAKKASKVVGAISLVGAAAVTAVGTKLISAGMEYNQQMEDYTTNFTVMLGSAEAAVKKVQELKDFAASTPFAMSDLADATQTLLAFGVSADDSTDILSMLGDVALGDSTKFSTLSNAFGKASSLGKLTGEIYQQMVTAGFNPLQVIASKTGETMEELQKRMSDGNITIDELTDAFESATSEGGQFYEGMLQASKTTSGLLSTLKDNATALLGKLAAPFSEVLKDTVLPKLLTLVDNLSTWMDENQDTITAIGEAIGNFLVGALEGLISAVDWMINNGDKMVGILIAVGAAIAAIMVIANPIPTAIALIGAAIAVIIAKWDDVVALFSGVGEWFTGIFTSAKDGIQSAWDSVTGFFAGVWEGIKGAFASTGEWFSTTFSNAKDGIHTAFSSIDTWMGSKFGDAWTAVKDAFSPFVDYFNQIWETVKGIFSVVKDVLHGDFSAAWEDIKEIFAGWGDFFSGLWESVKSAFSGASSAMKDIGKDIMTGLWEGINSKLTWLEEKVSSVTSSVTGWFKKLFGIASPSKVMRDEVGKYIPLGVAAGIDDTADTVKKSIDAMLDIPSIDTSASGVVSLQKETTDSSSAGTVSGGATVYQYNTYNANDTSYAKQERINQRNARLVTRELSALGV